MALTKASLSGKIETRIKAEYGGNPDDAALLKKFCDAVAEAVVDEITSNAVVMPTSMTAPNGGGAVSGTGTIT